MSKLFVFSLYFTSFMPLWISILFIDIKSCVENSTNVKTEIISIGLILILLLVTSIILLINLSSNEKNGVIEYELKNAIEEKTLTSEYLLSYILPLFAFDFTRWDNVILFLVFFVTLGFLCIKHNYFSINIILEIAGFSFYKCELSNNDGIDINTIVISYKNLNAFVGDSVYLRSINNQYKLNITRVK